MTEKLKPTNSLRADVEILARTNEILRYHWSLITTGVATTERAMLACVLSLAKQNADLSRQNTELMEQATAPARRGRKAATEGSNPEA